MNMKLVPDNEGSKMGNAFWREWRRVTSQLRESGYDLSKIVLVKKEK